MGKLMASQLVLDALRMEDAPVLHVWRSDPGLRDGTLAYPFPTSVEAEEEWIRHFQPKRTPSDVCLALRHAASGVLAGYVQLRGIDWIARVAEFGIVIGPSVLRRAGLGKRGLELTRDYAVSQLGLRKLWLRVVEYNRPAISLYEGSGFVQEGRLMRHVYRNGGLHDVLVYGWTTDAG